MLKFITANDIKANKNWLLCHDVYIGDKKLIKNLQINETVVRFVIGHLDSDFISTYLIISDVEKTESEIRDFIIVTLKNFIGEEIRYINDRYYDIISEEFSSRIKLLIEKAFRELSMDYVIPLITNPIVLKKSLNLSILSFYFGVKLDVKFKELDDLIYSSLLVNLNMCNGNSLKSLHNIHNENFLIDYKESLIHSSYGLISEDPHITNNVKRLVKYANVSQPNSSDIYYKTNEETGEKEGYLKDVTLEILQMSNDILTFDFNSDDIKNFYSVNKYTSVMQPAINMILSDIYKKKHTTHHIEVSLGTKIKSVLKHIFIPRNTDDKK